MMEWQRDFFKPCHKIEGGRLVLDPEGWVRQAQMVLEAFDASPSGSLILEVTIGLHSANAFASGQSPDRLTDDKNAFVDLSGGVTDAMRPLYMQLRAIQSKYVGEEAIDEPAVTRIGQDALELADLRHARRMQTMPLELLAKALTGLGERSEFKPRPKRQGSDLPAFEAPDTLDKLFGKRPNDPN
jgi:hypothetical protein